MLSGFPTTTEAWDRGENGGTKMQELVGETLRGGRFWFPKSKTGLAVEMITGASE
jgi:hypothetical protein